MKPGSDPWKIRVDDLQGAEIISLLHEHLRSMERVSPPESRHALDLAALRRPEITFWTLWERTELAGCGALKELAHDHAEIKSMRTTSAYQRRGVASKLLQHMITEAERRGYQRLSLEPDQWIISSQRAHCMPALDSRAADRLTNTLKIQIAFS